MSSERQVSTPLHELAQPQCYELLERWLDLSRAEDHGLRLAAAYEVDIAGIIAQAESPEALAAELAQIELLPVLTSHPSEMRTPAVLAALATSDDAETALVNLGGVSDRVNMERPTIAHEVATLLEHFSRVIFDAVATFYDDLETAARSRFGEAAPPIPTLLRFHSWVGCDRDGNPECTAAATLATAAQMHRCIITRYQSDLGRIAQLADAPLAQDLLRIRDGLEIVDDVTPMADHAFAQQLARLRASAHPPEITLGLKQIERCFATFGFHLATLEWRQHSDFILFAFDEREHALRPTHLRMRELDPNYRDTRIRESFDDDVAYEEYEHLLTTPKAVELMQSLQVLAEIRRRYGAAAVGELIISNCEDAQVYFALERLARDVDMFARGELPIVPLFESLSALTNGPSIIGTLLLEPLVRMKLRRMDDRFEIMVGYSDAAKDGGRIAADILITEAQRNIVDACISHAVTPLFFHGRGGSLGRGYTSIAQAMEQIDHRLPPGELKITEQGEIVANRYGHPILAAHTLRTWFCAALHCIRDYRHGASIQDPANDELEHAVAREGTRVFRDLRESQTFMESVRTLTQLDIVRGFPLSSRPASRHAGRHSTIDLASLRAVPFNISFNLSFAQVPAWFGTGSALQTALHRYGETKLRSAYTHRPVFRAAINRAAAALSATNLCIMHERSMRESEAVFFSGIAAEEKRARDAIAVITGERPEISPLPSEHTGVAELARFLDAQRDDVDLYGSYLALATIAATLGATG